MKIEEKENDYCSTSKKIKHSIEYTISIDNDIDEPHYYRDAIAVLKNATEKDVVYLEINTFGGYVHTAVQIINTIYTCKARVVARVVTAYSAGAMIALACNNFEVATFASLMIHTATGISYGKIPDLVNHANFNEKRYDKMCKELYQGFLTEEELNDVIKGADLWFDEKDIIKRLKNRSKFFEDKYKKNSKKKMEKEKRNGKK